MDIVVDLGSEQFIDPEPPLCPMARKLAGSATALPLLLVRVRG